jgi:hypothetical protein
VHGGIGATTACPGSSQGERFCVAEFMNNKQEIKTANDLIAMQLLLDSAPVSCRKGSERAAFRPDFHTTA